MPADITRNALGEPLPWEQEPTPPNPDPAPAPPPRTWPEMKARLDKIKERIRSQRMKKEDREFQEISSIFSQ